MDDSIAMTTIMVKAECKADPVPSESGSEVALSPAGGVENDVGAQVSKVEPVRSGIKIQRTIHVSVSGTS